MILLLLIPGAAGAGAWARGKGQTFISAGIEFRQDGEMLGTAYTEWGASESVTFGLDAYYDTSSEELSNITFLRYTFPSSGRHVFALGAGYGTNARVASEIFEFAPGEFVTNEWQEAGGFYRLSAHYGYGFDWGWAAIDVMVDNGDFEDTRGNTGTFQYRKIDGTLGYRWTDRIAVIGQIFTFDDGDFSAATYALGGTYDFPWLTLEMSLRQPNNGADAALKVALWHEF
ncbi:MAG: hypothetical protein AAGI10_05860 [Pseudomonadota bacterium]